MAESSLLITNIGRLVTMDPREGREGPLGIVRGAAVRVRDGRIVWVGSSAELPDIRSHERVIDAAGRAVLPGLVDCHTHLVHGGSREEEFDLRSQGKSYQEIAAGGGSKFDPVLTERFIEYINGEGGQ